MSVQQYLERYCETESSIADAISQSYDYVLCIPVFNEKFCVIERLQTFSSENTILIILLLNAPDNASKQDLKTTREFLSDCKSRLPLQQEVNNDAILFNLKTDSAHDILLIDRCSKDGLIPAKQGVGLARKIACDLACKLISQKKILKPWIFCTDADTLLPDNYFKALDTLEDKLYCGAVFPFQHIEMKPSSDFLSLSLAQKLYDFSLHYYVAALHWAKSPYAYHTIGSTLVIHYESYAQVRGFPKRPAAEDFYILNKLVKTRPLYLLEGPVINIETRLSDRVPFGTGPALTDILKYNSPLAEYLYYHPACFVYLRAFLAAIPQLYNEEETILLKSEKFRKVLSDNANIDEEKLLQVLGNLDFDKALEHANRQSKTGTQFEKHIHDWFDGFKSLKYIHEMRKLYFPSINIEALVSHPDSRLIFEDCKSFNFSEAFHKIID